MSSLHQTYSTNEEVKMQRDNTVPLDMCSTSSESDSTEDEEGRLKQLFSSCDRDGDGFIDRQDLFHMCRILNMEEVVDEIIDLLGMSNGPTSHEFAHVNNDKISFEDFMRCRLHLGTDQKPRLEALQSQLSQYDTMQLELMTQANDVINAKSNEIIWDLRSSLQPCVSLYQLLESKEPYMLQNYMEALSSHKLPNILQVANDLHLAAVSSLKNEIVELSTRLQRLATERELVDKQLVKLQMERLRVQREGDEKMEQQAVRYEDRITELHSVIAELRKKIDLRQINIIREEEECEESDGVASIQSVEDGSVNCSRTGSVADLGNELSRVMSNYQFALSRSDEAIGECPLGNDEKITKGDTTPCMPMMPFQVESGEREIHSLQAENARLLDVTSRQQDELGRFDVELNSVRNERDLLRNKVVELQRRSQEVLSLTQTAMSPQSIKSNSGPNSPLSPVHSHYVGAPVSKVAELKKLRTGRLDKPVLGAEISSLGVMNTKVAEHLSQDIQECSRVQEILQQRGSCGRDVADDVVHEFEIELERLQSKVDHLKAQNDVLSLTLGESKAHSDHLTILIGKYESNITALQLSVNGFDQVLEIFHVLLNLLDAKLVITSRIGDQTELYSKGLSVLSANQLVIDSNTLTDSIAANYMTAKSAAKRLLLQLDREVSSTSDREEKLDFSSSDEVKLRKCLKQLLEDRSTILQTVMPLESINVESASRDGQSSELSETQRIDLENAVLMQELMSIKEEKAELKSINCRLMKELNELKNIQRQAMNASHRPALSDDDSERLQACQSSHMSCDLDEALKRECQLKARVRELTMSLEKLSKNSELRYQQSAGFVNELKKANSALVCAFEKAKKKYVVKIKKLETQLVLMCERHESQVTVLRQKLSITEEELRRFRPGFSASSL